MVYVFSIQLFYHLEALFGQPQGPGLVTLPDVLPPGVVVGLDGLVMYGLFQQLHEGPGVGCLAIH